MTRALTVLLAFQAMGELIFLTLTPNIPGPVWGLVLLLGYFFIRRGVPQEIEQVAGVFTANLGLLFVPAAVGVVVFWPLLAEQGLVILVSLFVSVVLVLGLTAKIVDWIAGKYGIGPSSEVKEDSRA